MEVSDWAVICTTTTTTITLGVCSVREYVLIIVTIRLTCILSPSVYKHFNVLISHKSWHHLGRSYTFDSSSWVEKPCPIIIVDFISLTAGRICCAI